MSHREQQQQTIYNLVYLHRLWPKWLLQWYFFIVYNNTDPLDVSYADKEDEEKSEEIPPGSEYEDTRNHTQPAPKLPTETQPG